MCHFDRRHVHVNMYNRDLKASQNCPDQYLTLKMLWRGYVLIQRKPSLKNISSGCGPYGIKEICFLTETPDATKNVKLNVIGDVAEYWHLYTGNWQNIWA